MTVYIVVAEHWDDTEILGVYATQEAAKESAAGGAWVRSGDWVELAGLDYGRRIVIQSHDVLV